MNSHSNVFFFGAAYLLFPYRCCDFRSGLDSRPFRFRLLPSGGGTVSLPPCETDVADGGGSGTCGHSRRTWLMRAKYVVVVVVVVYVETSGTRARLLLNRIIRYACPGLTFIYHLLRQGERVIIYGYI